MDYPTRSIGKSWFRRRSIKDQAGNVTGTEDVYEKGHGWINFIPLRGPLYDRRIGIVSSHCGPTGLKPADPRGQGYIYFTDGKGREVKRRIIGVSVVPYKPYPGGQYVGSPPATDIAVCMLDKPWPKWVIPFRITRAKPGRKAWIAENDGRVWLKRIEMVNGYQIMLEQNQSKEFHSGDSGYPICAAWPGKKTFRGLLARFLGNRIISHIKTGYWGAGPNYWYYRKEIKKHAYALLEELGDRTSFP